LNSYNEAVVWTEALSFFCLQISRIEARALVMWTAFTVLLSDFLNSIGGSFRNVNVFSSLKLFFVFHSFGIYLAVYLFPNCCATLILSPANAGIRGNKI
jgi:hypothetical protein